MDNSTYNKIISRIEAMSRRYLLVGVAEVFFMAIALWGGIFGIFAFFESVLYMSPLAKKLLFFSSFIIPSGVFFVLFTIRLLRRPDRDNLSRCVERTSPNSKTGLSVRYSLAALRVTNSKASLKTS